MKIYTIPAFSRTLTKTLKDGNWKIQRNSKSVVTITNGGMPAMSFTMHLDFDAKRVTTVNLRIRCSGYKNVTIPIKTSDMKVLIKLEAAFNKMLQADEINENKEEVSKG